MFDLFLRRFSKDMAAVENNIRFLKEKKSLTNYEKGQLHILEEELSRKNVEFSVFKSELDVIENK